MMMMMLMYVIEVERFNPAAAAHTHTRTHTYTHTHTHTHTAAVMHEPPRLLAHFEVHRIYTTYMTVYMVISLPKTAHIHCIYMILANPTKRREVQKKRLPALGGS